MKQIILVLLTVFCCATMQAQCPNTNRAGIHVVQPQQTLYRISKMYNVSISDLMLTNGITNSNSISVCQELKIPNGVTFYDKGAQSRKIVTPAAQPVSAARRVMSTNSSSYADRLISSRGTHIANSGETIESIAQYYGYTPERLREMNSLDYSYQPSSGAVIVVNECYFEKGTSRMGQAKVMTQPQRMPTTQTNGRATNTYSPPSTTTNPPTTAAPKPSTGSKATKATAAYMKSEELEMVDEVNLVRSNPAGYIPIIEAYKKRIAAGTAFGSVSTCDELIAELRSTPSLSVLQPKECVYQAAQAHGEDNRRRGSNDHVGSDGSWPWDRVLRSCPDLSDGNENLVGGPSSVRDAVTILLIDDGIPGRGHRKTMLRPDWTYIACYKTGMVGQMPNSWVQKFGK